MKVTSLNNQTASILLKNLNTLDLDFKVDNIKLNNDYSESIITYKITHKINESLTSSKTINFKLEYSQVVEQINKLQAISELDQIFDVDYYELSRLKADEFKTAFDLDKVNKPQEFVFYSDQKHPFVSRKHKYLQESFEYKIKAIPEYKDQKLVATVQFLFNGNVLFEKELTTKQTFDFLKADNPDEIDYKKAEDIIKSKIEILLRIFLKRNSKITHSDIYPDQAIEKLEELYDLPTFGKYRIAPKSIVKAYDAGDQFGGAAEIQWSIQQKDENSEYKWVDTATKITHKIEHFKRYQYEDFIKPKNNEFFVANDFKSDNQLDQIIIEAANQLNEADIDFRKVQGRAVNEKSFTLYRNLNIKKLLAQKASIKANYFLRLKWRYEKTTLSTSDNQKPGEYIDQYQSSTPPNISLSNADTNYLISQTFYYFYDIKELEDYKISFRIGFVDKKDRTKRYSPNKVFTLNNIINDYEQNLYPEIMLNNITYDNLSFNKELLASKTAQEWKNNLEELNQAITLKNSEQNKDLLIDDNFIIYKDFKLKKTILKLLKWSNIKLIKCLFVLKFLITTNNE
ncbi:hypothetical protein [Ureaplasma diversum]|uniref:hypothetical protein n=1 Tax=Ureaplasma diversum TaxID=42094 RepID=UPI0005716514|nr:hypothetical protein [Ureaplasma diversum]